MPEIFGAALMGGGSGPAFAAIDVTYTAGATCTCALGSKTFTAPDTSGQALFVVPTAGQWMVTISQSGEVPVSETVNVTEGKAYTVALSFTLYLVKDGDPCENVTGGYTAVSWGDSQYVAGTPTVSYSGGAMTIVQAYKGINTRGRVYCNNQIDFSKYKTLFVELECSSATGNAWSYVGILSDKNNPSSSLASISTTINSGKVVKSVDVSEIVSGFLNIAMNAGTEQITTKIYNAWLSNEVAT